MWANFYAGAPACDEEHGRFAGALRRLAAERSEPLPPFGVSAFQGYLMRFRDDPAAAADPRNVGAFLAPREKAAIALLMPTREVSAADGAHEPSARKVVWGWHENVQRTVMTIPQFLSRDLFLQANHVAHTRGKRNGSSYAVGTTQLLASVVACTLDRQTGLRPPLQAAARSADLLNERERNTGGGGLGRACFTRAVIMHSTTSGRGRREPRVPGPRGAAGSGERRSARVPHRSFSRQLLASSKHSAFRLASPPSP